MSEHTPGEVVECPHCHGEYMPVQRDGSAYTHVCPTPTESE